MLAQGFTAALLHGLFEIEGVAVLIGVAVGIASICECRREKREPRDHDNHGAE